MSTKEWVYHEHDRYGVYQEISFDESDINSNPVLIEITNPVDFQLSSMRCDGGHVFSVLVTEIPAETFDAIAIAWCRTRNLSTT